MISVFVPLFFHLDVLYNMNLIKNYVAGQLIFLASKHNVQMTVIALLSCRQLSPSSPTALCDLVVNGIPDLLAVENSCQFWYGVIQETIFFCWFFVLFCFLSYPNDLCILMGRSHLGHHLGCHQWKVLFCAFSAFLVVFQLFISFFFFFNRGVCHYAFALALSLALFPFLLTLMCKGLLQHFLSSSLRFDDYIHCSLYSSACISLCNRQIRQNQ